MAKTDTDRIPDGINPKGVKLSCRHIWKVYGDDSARYFAKRDSKAASRVCDGAVADTEATIRQIRADGLIPAAADVSFDVHEGEIFVIMGLSGSGKSTMVRCLSRLVEPTAGEVLLDGENLLEKSTVELTEIRRHKMGMVFQSFGLLPHLNVLDNVAFPLRVQGLSPAKRREKAMEMVRLVGLEGREHSFPHQLSGGQQQRVGIARSLAVEPELWFLDEPFSALDPLIRRQMQDEFVRLQRMLSKTIVFITHDFLEALKIADRIAIMKDGRVVQIGTPSEIVLNPADDYVHEFTDDVPLVRVVTVGDVMEPLGAGETAKLSRYDVRKEMSLEEVLGHFAHVEASLTVVDEAGLAIGRVTPDRIVRALAHSEHRSIADITGETADNDEPPLVLEDVAIERDTPITDKPVTATAATDGKKSDRDNEGAREG